MTLDDFRAVYERHVGHVRSGAVKSALYDMLPENLPTVFDGIEFPKGAVTGAEIRRVAADGDRRIGEAVYHTPAGPIGLRSIWEWREQGWKAAALENFPVDAETLA